MEGWIEVHNEEPHNFCSLPNISLIRLKEVACLGLVACVDEMRNVCKIMV
jgi:hypothetical protein